MQVKQDSCYSEKKKKIFYGHLDLETTNKGTILKGTLVMCCKHRYDDFCVYLFSSPMSNNIACSLSQHNDKVDTAG